MILALVYKNSQAAGVVHEEGSDTYAGLYGAGDYGRCITELKHRCVCNNACARACVLLSLCTFRSYHWCGSGNGCHLSSSIVPTPTIIELSSIIDIANASIVPRPPFIHTHVHACMHAPLPFSLKMHGHPPIQRNNKQQTAYTCRAQPLGHTPSIRTRNQPHTTYTINRTNIHNQPHTSYTINRTNIHIQPHTTSTTRPPAGHGVHREISARGTCATVACQARSRLEMEQKTRTPCQLFLRGRADRRRRALHKQLMPIQLCSQMTP